MTFTVWPATVSEPTRGTPAVLVSTENTTVPEPIRLADVTLIQVTVEAADQPPLQFEGDDVTFTVFPVVAADVTVNVSGETVSVHWAASGVTRTKAARISLIRDYVSVDARRPVRHDTPAKSRPRLECLHAHR